jgi:hypothetical protein
VELRRAISAFLVIPEVPPPAQDGDRHAAERDSANGRDAACSEPSERDENAVERRIRKRWHWPAALIASAAFALLASLAVCLASVPRSTRKAPFRSAAHAVGSRALAPRRAEPIKPDVAAHTEQPRHPALRPDGGTLPTEQLIGAVPKQELYVAVEEHRPQQHSVPSTHEVDMDLSFMSTDSTSLAPAARVLRLATAPEATRNPGSNASRVEPGMVLRPHLRAYPKHSIYARDPYER